MTGHCSLTGNRRNRASGGKFSEKDFGRHFRQGKMKTVPRIGKEQTTIKYRQQRREPKEQL